MFNKYINQLVAGLFFTFFPASEEICLRQPEYGACKNKTIDKQSVNKRFSAIFGLLTEAAFVGILLFVCSPFYDQKQNYLVQKIESFPGKALDFWSDIFVKQQKRFLYVIIMVWVEFCNWCLRNILFVEK